MKKEKIKERLDYLREEIKKGEISYEEIAELAELQEHIEESDTTLKEWAGINEFMEKCPNCGKWVKNEKIYSTHEDNDDPNNQEYCELCQEDVEKKKEEKKDDTLKLYMIEYHYPEDPEENIDYDWTWQKNEDEVRKYMKEERDGYDINDIYLVSEAVHKDSLKKEKEDNTLIIEVEGGMVVDVKNLPDNYDYVVDDKDVGGYGGCNN